MSLRITGGEFRSQILHAPKSSVRPTTSLVREVVFNICQNRVEGSTFLDLFAGSGIMGIEALSRKASLSVFVDHSKQSIQYIKKNIEKLHLQDRSYVFFDTALKALDKCKQKNLCFDLVYLDPPYDSTYKNPEQILKVFQKLEENDLLSHRATIFFEHKKEMLNFDFANKLHFIKKIRSKTYGNSSLTQFFSINKA